MPHDYKRVLAELAAEEAANAAHRATVRGEAVDAAASARRSRTARLMGELGGFLKIERARASPTGTPPSASSDYKEFLRRAPGRGAARPGRALHGLRRAVLPQRLPAGQPDPGLERPRLPRPLAGRDRASCTRRTTSPSSPAACARRRARPRACSRSARATRSRSSRSRTRSSTAPGRRAGSSPQPPAARDRPLASPSSARARPAWPPRSSCAASGHRVVAVRARRGRRRARALRRAGLQDREAGRRAARRAAGRRGRRAALRRRRRRRRHRRGAARRVRRGRARDRLARAARPAGPGPRARGHPLRDGLPLRAQPLGRGESGRRRVPAPAPRSSPPPASTSS